MTKNKNNTSVWNTRIKKSSSLFQKVGSSISFDKRLFKEDIQASIAHVEMLFKKKIITFKVKNKIIFGLNRIRNEIVKKKHKFDNKDEDIHMSIEKRLFEIIGEDEPHQLDPETIFFITSLLNETNLIQIRNKVLISALPQRI